MCVSNIASARARHHGIRQQYTNYLAKPMIASAVVSSSNSFAGPLAVSAVAAAAASVAASTVPKKDVAIKREYRDRSRDVPEEPTSSFSSSQSSSTSAAAARALRGASKYSVAQSSSSISSSSDRTHLPHFPLRLHALLDSASQTWPNKGDQCQDEIGDISRIISWQPHGRSFVIHRPHDFASIIMPRHFPGAKFSSFQRQLNLYGFTRLTSGLDRGGYYHECFLRSKPELAKRISRRRIKGTGVRTAVDPDSEPNFYAMPPVGGDPERESTKAEYLAQLLRSQVPADKLEEATQSLLGQAAQRDNHKEKAAAASVATPNLMPASVPNSPRAVPTPQPQPPPPQRTLVVSAQKVSFVVSDSEEDYHHRATVQSGAVMPAPAAGTTTAKRVSFGIFSEFEGMETPIEVDEMEMDSIFD